MRRPKCKTALAPLILCLIIIIPTTASAFRHGMGSTMGGATLGAGHQLWIASGYPRTTVGWTVGLHRIFDLSFHGDLLYGSPVELGDSFVGGGGGLRGRLGFYRGRASGAILFGTSATAYGEGGGVAALVDLGSPSMAVSLRLSERVALHGAVELVLQLVTTPFNFLWGVEGSLGITMALVERLSLFVSALYGTTIWDASEHGTARFEALLGLEYHLGS